MRQGTWGEASTVAKVPFGRAELRGNRTPADEVLAVGRSSGNSSCADNSRVNAQATIRLLGLKAQIQAIDDRSGDYPDIVDTQH